MKNSIITIIIIIIIIILGVWLYTASSSTVNIQSNANAPTTIDNNLGGTTAQLFSDSPLASNAYLISTLTYDANTKKALSGFIVTKKVLTDGSTQYTLKAQDPKYQTQIYTVKPGEKLYFIEQNLSDDNGSTDKFPGDDTAILVDANGYIINQ
ncbi:MAG: hypothetical protein WCS86_00465 [Candidatus Paceibacterota bacterium]